MKLFDNIQKLDDDRENYIKEYVNSIKMFPYIYLWGISESCDEAILFFNKYNIKIQGIYNVNSEKYNFLYKDIPVIEQSFDNIDINAAIIVTCSYY